MQFNALLCSLLTTFGLTGPVAACELALLLAVDVSGSVDNQEYEIQMRGLAEAFRDGAISEALVVSKSAVMVMQWTGSSRQRVSIPWTRIENFDDVANLAVQIETTPRVWRNFATAIGEALITAERQFAQVTDCKRHVIDVSGDGFSNEGPNPEAVRDVIAAKGITINGLAIEASEKGLTEYYRANLIAGPGAFAIGADDFKQYPDRIRRKLLREIAKQVSTLGPVIPNGRL
jgi:Ca-activated chloride channel family protein